MADQFQQPFASQLVAGDDWSWTVSVQNYPPSSYTLKYFLRGPAKLDLAAVAAPNGSDFMVTGASADTSKLQAGVYGWQMCVFDAAGKRTELARGQVEIIADIASQDAGVDDRSWVKVSLDAVRAVIQGRASRVERQYMIAGRELQLLSPEDLLKLEGQLAARYRREQIESGQLPPQTNQVQAAFGDASNPVLVRMWKNFPGNSA